MSFATQKSVWSSVSWLPAHQAEYYLLVFYPNITNSQFYSPVLNMTAFPTSPMCAKSKQGGYVVDMEANIRHRWIKIRLATYRSTTSNTDAKSTSFTGKLILFKLLVKGESPTTAKT